MKEEIQNMDDALLVKYLLNEATEAEMTEVTRWRAADLANDRYFENFRVIWEESKKLSTTSTVDEQAAWERFKIQRPAVMVPVVKGMRARFRWMRAAVILLLITAGGWLAYGIFHRGGQRMNGALLTIQSHDVPLTDTLPDGSVVTLNRNSTLSYPADFRGKERNIRLRGEAFFDVARDEHKPFIVRVNNIKVTVLGTSFNIKDTKSKTEVIVETGMVEVAKKKQAIRVSSHEKAIVYKDAKKPIKQNNADELYNYYKTKEFICNGTHLQQLVDVLNEAYNAHIMIANDTLKELPLTTTFQNEPLDKILGVIGETFNISIEKSGQQIILK